MWIKSLVAALALAALPAAGHAAVVGFDDLGGGHGSAFASHHEDGFTITQTAGVAVVGVAKWPTGPYLRVPPYPDVSCLTCGHSATIEITAGGKTFSFQSWELGASSRASYTISGFLDNANTFNVSGVREPGGFETMLSGTDLMFDRLNVSLTTYMGAAVIDNFDLTISAVPEPATWAMMITGFGLAGATLRQRRRQTTFA